MFNKLRKDNFFFFILMGSQTRFHKWSQRIWTILFIPIHYHNLSTWEIYIALHCILNVTKPLDPTSTLVYEWWEAHAVAAHKAHHCETHCWALLICASSLQHVSKFCMLRTTCLTFVADGWWHWPLKEHIVMDMWDALFGVHMHRCQHDAVSIHARGTAQARQHEHIGSAL